MSIYTFILDYLGGTYVSQVVSSDEFSAMHLWIEQLETIEIQNFTENDKQNIILSKFEDENPILLKGLTNICHFLISTQKGVGYVNFVKTCDKDYLSKCLCYR